METIWILFGMAALIALTHCRRSAGNALLGYWYDGSEAAYSRLTDHGWNDGGCSGDDGCDSGGDGGGE